MRLASPAAAPENATSLGELGIQVDSHVDLDADPGPAEIEPLSVPREGDPRAGVIEGPVDLLPL